MRKLKITSLVLAVIMVVSLMPLGMVSIFATESSDGAYLIGTADDFMTFYGNLGTTTARP